jgi:hypothetical protein
MSNNSGLATYDAVTIQVPIAGKTYAVTECMVDQADLLYYVANPRVFSLLHIDGAVPDQDDFEKFFHGKEKVRKLSRRIARNGGLLDPVLVKAATREVFEGNTRLAACRLLFKKDPITWGRIRAHILPPAVDESSIASVLSEYHIFGKDDWATYEQSNFFYRRHFEQGITITDMLEETGLSRPTLLRYIGVIKRMRDNKDDCQGHYSAYLQLNNKHIKRAIEDTPKIESCLISLIKSDKVAAMEIREKVSVICATQSDQPRKLLLDGKPVDTAYATAQALGGDNNALKLLAEFRESVSSPDLRQKVAATPHKIKAQIKWQLEQIRTAVNKLLKAAKKGTQKSSADKPGKILAAV